jgi:glycerol-3-phosphate dehydrogenase (NAD(P)+)
MKLAVIGAGSFGTTLAHLWAGADHDIRLWAREPEVVESINSEHRNCLFNSQFELHPALRATGDMRGALSGAEAIVLAVPSKFIREFAPTVREAMHQAAVKPNTPFVSVVKGMMFYPTELVSECMLRELEPFEPAWMQLCGPNLSGEIMAGQPTASVLASRENELATQLQHELSTPRLRLYTSRDPVGVEVCGALKNILAVAAGLAAGLGLGLNSRGVLLTRGVVEMRRLLPVFGGDPHTLYGLAGFGDIIATAFSENSRNHRAGVEFAKGMTLAEVESETKMVAEGVRTVRAVVEFLEANEHFDLELPITRETYAVIYDAKPPRDAIASLMSRPYKEEG